MRDESKVEYQASSIGENHYGRVLSAAVHLILSMFPENASRQNEMHLKSVSNDDAKDGAGRQLAQSSFPDKAIDRKHIQSNLLAGSNSYLTSNCPNKILFFFPNDEQ